MNKHTYVIVFPKLFKYKNFNWFGSDIFICFKSQNDVPPNNTDNNIVFLVSYHLNFFIRNRVRKKETIENNKLIDWSTIIIPRKKRYKYKTRNACITNG